MNENAITQRVIATLNGIEGCRAKKRHGGKFQSGEPDVAGCYRGWTFFVEVKLDSGELTKLQATELDKWRSSWAKTAVAVWRPALKNFLLVEPDANESWIEMAGSAKSLVGDSPGSKVLSFGQDDWKEWLVR